MFEKIKSYFTAISLVWRHAGVIANLVSQWMRYPGIENSEALRVWIRLVLNDLATLTSATETPIDDMIAVTALRIVENDKAWSVVHKLALLVHYGGDMSFGHLKLSLEYDTVDRFPLYDTSEQRERVSTASGSSNCGEAARFHAAIGLLLYLLQQRFGKGAS